MAASMDLGLLPMIKCSNCGMSVEISAMGDHVCAKSDPAPPPPPAQSPPRPPSKSSIGSPPKAGNAWAARAGRMNPPPRIDPLVANRPFLRPHSPIDNKGLLPSPLSTSISGGPRSPLRPPQRSQTSPLPQEPQSPDSINMETAFASFPLPRSMSDRRPNAEATVFGNVPPLQPARHASSMSRDSSHAPVELPADNEVPPPPLPKDGPPLPGVSHRYGASIDSKSSYRTSVASTRYSDHRNSKRSTAMSSRRPSFGSVSRDHLNYIDEEAPPVPAPAPQGLLLPARLSTTSGAELAEKPEGRGEIYSGFDFGVSARPTSAKAEIDHVGAASLRVSSSHTNRSSDRLSSNRGSAELFFQSPTPSPYEAPVDFELRDDSAASPAAAAPASAEYKAFKPVNSEPSQSTDTEPTRSLEESDRQRKDSDSTSESNISVSNFARALGLDVPDHVAESSITSSDSSSSPSDTRSGTSLSSLPSEASLSRRQPSDPSRLGPVVEGLKGDQHPKEPVLDESVTESPIDLEPPRITEHLFSPDSPTDPAISQGSLSLVSEKLPRKPDNHQPERPTMLRSATAPAPRPSPRPKGPCRGCGEMILGKSVSSADGRLTGRYHRACFVCFQCKTPFQTADFYVLEDRPFCAQHYHERNGSLCATCHTGIEGQYLETVERRGRGPGDRQKFHPDCLKCRTCGIALNGDYFEWYGQVYCERDARQAAAASMPPPRPPRSPRPMSPMGPPSGRGYPPPPGYGGRGRGRPPPGPRPGSAASQAPPIPMLRPPGPGDGPYGAIGALPSSRRFPERRTTKLMMI
ncbi:LIM domain-containing protein [Aspergillus homomorphus CBS 101889]|uniref:LIM zinc-binding domain-containing protein n=1 Tax=Aspergillus homomorphus (strain CBS 101889) TaxID=1450537 RepID=A0A395I560_ASPHC|nr:hypothetical protein BO97DRAFT_365297 [Aspergillus homomorphus CBS 101889]RAL14328.1 hypothetical protein BO97DRAFT_365297 [Aspergillus homomorphus CBS 101889]